MIYCILLEKGALSPQAKDLEAAMKVASPDAPPPVEGKSSRGVCVCVCVCVCGYVITQSCGVYCSNTISIDWCIYCSLVYFQC